MSPVPPAFQAAYPDDVAHCYGCGRLNEHGHRLESRWSGDETVARFTPKPYHTAIPGYVYGGLIASLVDCHGTGTAAAVPERPAPAATARPTEYTIRSGDTLDAIAKRHGTTVDALRRANPGLDPRRLIPGRKIRLN